MKRDLFFAIEQHLMRNENPSEYLETLLENPALQETPFDMLFQLKRIRQSPKYHPEGNVWIHTMMVTDWAARVKEQSSDKTVFLWAALLHDIGKGRTTRIRKGKITSYDHDKVGKEMAKEFFSHFEVSPIFVEKVAALVRWHMQILYVVKDLRFADIQSMEEQTDIREVALLGLCDRMGRVGTDLKKEEENIRIFLQKCGRQMRDG